MEWFKSEDNLELWKGGTKDAFYAHIPGLQTVSYGDFGDKREHETYLFVIPMSVSGYFKLTTEGVGKPLLNKNVAATSIENAKEQAIALLKELLSERLMNLQKAMNYLG